jgi:hypothetical protein
MRSILGVQVRPESVFKLFRIRSLSAGSNKSADLQAEVAAFRDRGA